MATMVPVVGFSIELTVMTQTKVVPKKKTNMTIVPITITDFVLLFNAGSHIIAYN